MGTTDGDTNDQNVLNNQNHEVPLKIYNLGQLSFSFTTFMARNETVYTTS